MTYLVVLLPLDMHHESFHACHLRAACTDQAVVHLVRVPHEQLAVKWLPLSRRSLHTESDISRYDHT